MNENLQRVGFLALVPTILTEFGVAASQALEAVGLPTSALNDPEGKIPYLTMGRLLEECVRLTGCPHFGLIVGQRASTGTLGAIGDLMAHAPTLGVAIRDLVQHQHRHARGGVVYLVEIGQEMVFGYAVYESDIVGAMQLYDGAVAMAVGIVRRALGVSELAGLEVMLSRRRPRQLEPYNQWFGVSARFDCDYNAVMFPREWMDRKVVGADPVQRKQLESAITSYWRAGEFDFVSRLQRALSVGLLTGDTSKTQMALKLGISMRTLQRRLNELGATYQTVLDETRFESAKQFLANTNVDIAHIASILGYSNQSVFNRAFTRWSGGPPGEWRRATGYRLPSNEKALPTSRMARR